MWSRDEYRGSCLELFLSRGPSAQRRRTLLWWWCNGDLRDTSSIQHHPRDIRGPRLPLEELNKEMTQAILAAISSKTPSTFPRHRWTGADLSLGELGLLLCLHGVLIDAYVALLAFGQKGARAWNPRQPSAPSDAGALMDLGVGESAGGSGEVDSDSDQEKLQPDLDEPATTTVSASEKRAQRDGCDWAQLNGKLRRGGFAFVKELPLGKIMLMRKCMEPLRVLVMEHLRLFRRGLGERAESFRCWGRVARAKLLAPSSRSSQPHLGACLLREFAEYHERRGVVEAHALELPDRAVQLLGISASVAAWKCCARALV